VFLRACDWPDDERQRCSQPGGQASDDDATDPLCSHMDSLSVPAAAEHKPGRSHRYD
jgi:hypothetical protein